MTDTMRSHGAPARGPSAAAAAVSTVSANALMRLTDPPMRAVQRLIGAARMPYVFLLPNLVFFGLFVFLPIGINIVFSVTGGTAPFTYAWSPSGGSGATASGLCAGSYTCTATDAAGCSGTQTFTITQPPQITATQSQVNVSCNGACNGSATVVASGGTGTYTYAWAPSGGTGATASGLALLGGLMTIAEQRQGTINHAIHIALPQTRRSVWAQPAQRTDGLDNNPNAIPEGARFRIPESVDLDQIAIRLDAQVIGTVWHVHRGGVGDELTRFVFPRHLDAGRGFHFHGSLLVRMSEASGWPSSGIRW